MDGGWVGIMVFIAFEVIFLPSRWDERQERVCFFPIEHLSTCQWHLPNTASEHPLRRCPRLLTAFILFKLFTTSNYPSTTSSTVHALSASLF